MKFLSIYGLFVALIQDVKGMCCLLDAADAKKSAGEPEIRA